MKKFSDFPLLVKYLRNAASQVKIGTRRTAKDSE